MIPEGAGLRSIYTELVDHVLSHGYETSPRGMKTREITGAQFVLHDPLDSVLDDMGRQGYKPAIGVAEGLQLVGGVSYPELLKKIASPFGNFMNGGTLLGAYGPRVRTQLSRVVERLADEDSRQCVLQIWRAQDDLWSTSGTGDIPCTLSLQFFLRNDCVECHVTMRSNDLWLGTTYDVMQFTMLQASIAHQLGAGVGKYVHTAGSLHLYERDWERARAVETTDASGDRKIGAVGHTDIHSVDGMMKAADAVLRSDENIGFYCPQWYRDELAPYLG